MSTSAPTIRPPSTTRTGKGGGSGPPKPQASVPVTASGAAAAASEAPEPAAIRNAAKWEESAKRLRCLASEVSDFIDQADGINSELDGLKSALTTLKEKRAEVPLTPEEIDDVVKRRREASDAITSLDLKIGFVNDRLKAVAASGTALGFRIRDAIIESLSQRIGYIQLVRIAALQGVLSRWASAEVQTDPHVGRLACSSDDTMPAHNIIQQATYMQSGGECPSEYPRVMLGIAKQALAILDSPIPCTPGVWEVQVADPAHFQDQL